MAIEALALLPGWRLLLVGEGPERARLEELAARLGVAGRVHLANVLLEAMACGTPVVASDIPGNPEVVRERTAGLIVPANTAAGFAGAVQALWRDPPARDAVRRYAERFSWDATSDGQLAVFAQARARFAARRPG